MSHAFLYIILVISLQVDAAENALSPVVRSILDQRLSTREITKIPASEIPRVVEELQAQRQKSEFTKFYGLKAELLLIELGQRQVLEEFLAAHYYPYGAQSGIAARGLLGLHQPYVLSRLANDLLKEEPVNSIPVSVEGSYYPASIMAGMIFRSILINADDFSPAVKEWVKSLRGETSTAFRETMRTFWRENAVHFAAEEYSKVHPPGQGVRKPMTLSNSMPTTTSSNAIAPAIVKHSAKPILGNPISDLSTVPPIPEAKPVEPAATPSARTWPWLVGITVILGVLLWRKTQ